MNISKKLFLITIIGLGINVQLCASETAANKVIDYAQTLVMDNPGDNDSRNMASWITSIYYGYDAHSKATMDRLEKTMLSDKIPDKKEAFLKLWKEDTTPQNEGYFANISTFAKAAAAAVITAGIISYFYFMRPWGTSTTQ
jgi:hypothetical protein